METSTAVPFRDLYDRFIIPTYARFNLAFVRGEGTYVWDAQGKRYLDFGAGIAVTSIGHCHPRVVAAMQRQIATLVHASNLYYTQPQAELAERLVRLVGRGGKVFFCNSGAEANEALYKLARKFGNEGVPGADRHTVGEVVEMNRDRHEIITMLGSFHGRTLAGIAATGQEKVKRGFEPAVQGFVHVPFNDAPALLAAVQSPDAIAVLLEPVQGEIGIFPASAAFLRHARDLCDRHNLLLFYDEVQCGLGRSGDWCGWKTITANDQAAAPDAMSWAKGIAGGFPLGGIWVSERAVQLKSGETKPLCDLLGPGSHGTTFGGTPIVSAGANEVLAVIEDEGMLENARTLGAYALTRLQTLGSPLIKEVRGVGLMLAVELVAGFADQIKTNGRPPSLFVVDRLHEAGLLTIPSGTHAFRWLPPLNVSREQIDTATKIVESVLCAIR
jgi:acetylornithine aminotransferase/acetylornithine/N-succinyldiaminopimelate aminotransferase